MGSATKRRTRVRNWDGMGWTVGGEGELGGMMGKNPLQFSLSSTAFHLDAQVRTLRVTLDSSNPSPNIQTSSPVTFAS